MSTTSVNHSSTSSIYRVDQAIDECDRNTCPNSLKRYRKFSCNCRGCHGENIFNEMMMLCTWPLFIQPSLNFVPQMFSRVQISFHRCSVGFKSGLRTGQFITLTLFCCKKSHVALAVCVHALSCWNVLF